MAGCAGPVLPHSRALMEGPPACLLSAREQLLPLQLIEVMGDNKIKKKNPVIVWLLCIYGMECVAGKGCSSN